MTRAITRDPIYRRRRYPAEIIELCVRWYITYRLSYRDLVAIVAERGVTVSHTTILRWVLRYVPEFEKRWAPYARPVNASWRVDETAVSVRGGKHYLYRAVDKEGKSVDHLLCADRSWKSGRAFFRRAVTTHATEWPRTVNLDGNMGSHLALRRLRKEDPRWEGVIVRGRRYLNNIVEQDHRAIKRRCASMLGFKSFRTATITLGGIELAHRIRKGQFAFGGGDQHGLTSLKQRWDRALAGVDSTDLESRNVPPCQPAANAPEPKQKTLALGPYPAVPIAKARVRHRAARNLLAAGTDPSLWRRELRTAAAADIANTMDPARPPMSCSIEEIFGRIRSAAASRAR